MFFFKSTLTDAFDPKCALRYRIRHRRIRQNKNKLQLLRKILYTLEEFPQISDYKNRQNEDSSFPLSR